MPIFKQGEGTAPAWSELKAFFFEYVSKGETKELKWQGPKERYIGIEGDVKVVIAGDEHLIKRGAFFDLPIGKDCIITTADERAGICRCRGDWGDELGGTGLFPVIATDNPVNFGDPTDYPRNASFDNHYHDCDEYWIVFQGSGVAYSEGERYEVGVGDCVATGWGYYHDFPISNETVCAVFFETTMVGQKRPGHLWEHTHGKPEPDKDRR